MDALLRRRAMIAAGGGEPPTPPPAPTLVFYDQLVFDGAAYIDTTVVPPTDASIRVVLGGEATKAAQRCIAAAGLNTATYFALLYNNGTNTTSRMFSVYYGGATALNTTKTLAFSTTRYAFFMTPQRFGWGSSSGNITTYTKGSDSPNGGIVLGSNGSHNGQAYTGFMEELTVYGSDAQNAGTAPALLEYTPVYTLKPCTYNGEAGMWCVETSQFFGNTAGAGTLTVKNRT